MKLYVCVFLIISMDILSAANPISGNGFQDPQIPNDVYNYMPAIAADNIKEDSHGELGDQSTPHHMFNVRELLLLKVILDRQLMSATTTKPTPDIQNEDEDEFDPVFGKIRDFLDELTVEDLERAMAKLKSWQAKHENHNDGGELVAAPEANEIPVLDPATNKASHDDNTISVKKTEQGPCKIAFDKAFASGSRNLPYCDENGFFVTRQCSGSVCFCVDKNGTPTMGQVPLWRVDDLTMCDKQESVDDAIEELRGLLDRHHKQTQSPR